MPEISPDELATAIVNKLVETHHAFWIDPQIHSEEHEFIRMMIKEREDKIVRRKALEDKIAGSLILAAILTVIGLLGAGALDYLRTHLK